MFKSLLVPVDIAETEVAQPGLDEAVEIAKASGGKLKLTYVRSPAPFAMNEYIPAEYYDSDEKAVLETLESMTTKLDLPKDRISFSSPFGTVYDEVLKQADEMKADLIVIGSHRPNWTTYLMGSNAAKIVRHAACSVLVVRLPNAPTPSF